MPEELDELIRASMKTLDEQVPSGYFEALSEKTLARLGANEMQHGSSGTTEQRDPSLPVGLPPPMAATQPPAEPAERAEDSGLHDIRNLAQSTKQRLSKRITSTPPAADDVLASSSAAWKNLALPEPAKMVSLPELADLPSKQEIVAADKASRKAAKAAAKAELAAPALAETAPAVTPLEAQRFTLPSQQGKKSKGPLLAVLGLGVAAAAGAVIFTQLNKGEQAAPSAAARAETVAVADPPRPEPVAAAPSVAPIEADPNAVEGAPEPDVSAQLAAAELEPTEAVDRPEKARKPGKPGKGGDAGKPEKAEKTVTVKDDKPAPPPKAEDKKPTAKSGEGEPSFDDLLKEAGVESKKDNKPKLENKELSAADFKKGMAAIQSKAQACYKGTQGTAIVKLTVGPSGQVSKVTVAGPFAGTPEGACVESAVKSASFPPWDGGPQSFNYSYLLAE
jgi:hypothetical protein